jgi:hypothetical protein
VKLRTAKGEIRTDFRKGKRKGKETKVGEERGKQPITLRFWNILNTNINYYQFTKERKNKGGGRGEKSEGKGPALMRGTRRSRVRTPLGVTTYEKKRQKMINNSRKCISENMRDLAVDEEVLNVAVLVLFHSGGAGGDPTAQGRELGAVGLMT